MGIFKTRNNGPVNFNSLVQTKQGKIFNRFEDLFGQFRADPITGKFEFIIAPEAKFDSHIANRGPRKVTTAGSLAGGVFTNNFQRKIPYAVFDGQSTKQSINYSDSGKEFRWFPEQSQDSLMHSGWINLRGLPAGVGGSPGGRAIFELSDGTYYSSTVYINSNGQLGYRIHDMNSTDATDFRGKLVPQSKRFKVGEWYHYVIIVDAPGSTIDGSDAGNFHFWINGIKIPDSTLVDEVGDTSFTMSQAQQLGKDPATFGFGRGGYDSSPATLQANAYLHAYLAEMCFWKSDPNQGGAAFTDADAEAVYRAYANVTSGMTNISERLMVRELDQHSTHPAVFRPGDPRRLGSHANTFDDSNVQSFLVPTANTKVQFPTKLVSGDKLLDSVYAGYTNGNLVVPNVSPSMEAVSMFHQRDDQPSHEPFVESRIYIDSGSVFYQTGTSETIIPGFSAPLHSKQAVVINLPIKTAIRLGDNADNNQAFPTAYYNFTNNKFDPLSGSWLGYSASGGEGHQNAANWLHNKNKTILTYAPWGNFLTGSTNIITAGNSISSGQQIFPTIKLLEESSPSFTAGLGKPTDIRGFPSDKRYFASGSQRTTLSTSIAAPFLLEKFVLEIEVDFDPSSNVLETLVPYTMESANKSDRRQRWLPIGKTNQISAFLLTQQRGTPQTFSRNAERYQVGTANIGNRLPDSIRHDFETGDFQRTYIGDGRALFSGLDRYVTETAIPNFHSNYDVVFDISGSSATSLDGVSEGFGKIRITGTPKNLLKHKTGKAHCLYDNLTADSAIMADGITVGGNVSFFGYEGGPKNHDPTYIGRNFNGTDEGTLGTEVINMPIDTGWAINVELAEGSTAQPMMNKPVTVSKTPLVTGNPTYVLHPNDELIIGLDVLMKPQNARGNNTYVSSHDDLNGNNLSADEPYIDIPVQEAKLTLFGSYLQASQPRKMQLNQLLTNDIIHESIGSGPILDQFDLEPLTAFSGSYVDVIMSGSTKGPLYTGWNTSVHVDLDVGPADSETHLARGFATQVTLGTQGTTGSLRRNVAFASHDKTEFDSFLLDMESTWAQTARSTGTGAFSGAYINDWTGWTALGFNFVDFMLASDDPSVANQAAEGESVGLRPDITFRRSFLFSKYSKIRRVRPSQILAANALGSVILTGSNNVATPGVIGGYTDQFTDFPVSGVNNDEAGIHYILTEFSRRELPDGVASVFIQRTTELNKILFGIGDGRQNAHRISGFYIADDPSRITISDIRGFRYGLSNIADKKPKNIFRRDRYGQFRDMLEGAPNTAYVDDATNTISFAVEAQFFDADGAIATPDQTSCSNLSTNCTSSAPFFDREVVEFTDEHIVRNRGPINNKVADVTIEL